MLFSPAYANFLISELAFLVISTGASNLGERSVRSSWESVMAIRVIAEQPRAIFLDTENGQHSVVFVSDEVRIWASELLPLISEKYIARRAIEIKEASSITIESDALFDAMSACKVLSDGKAFVPGEAIVDRAAWDALSRFAEDYAVATRGAA